MPIYQAGKRGNMHSSVFTVPISIASALFEKGIYYCLQYAVFYIYLTIRNIFWKKRLDLYDFEAIGQPEVNGFLIPKEEWIFEPPSKLACLEKISDDVFIWGTNSKSDYLAVYVRRMPENRVHCSLFLRLSDGKIYSLPKEHSIQKASFEDNTFGSSRLKLQCLLPMRKWRIFFNGILEETTSDEDDLSLNVYKHSRFSFIWTASSEVFDFASDLPKTTFSHVAAAFSWLRSPVRFLNELNESFNFYEQPGMILGTICIENEPEKELYLWGVRQRFMATPILFQNNIKKQEIYGSFEDGKQLYLALLNSKGGMKRLHYGYIMNNRGFIFPIDDIHEDSCQAEKRKIIIKCYSNNRWYNITVDQPESNYNSFRKAFGLHFNIQTTEMTMNGIEGKGFHFLGGNTDHSSLTTENSQKGENESTINAPSTLCLPFDNRSCLESELSGEKGSSLSHLYGMSWTSSENALGAKFHVPKGIIVSTAAYREFTKGSLQKKLNAFEKDIWTGNTDTPSSCQNMVELVCNMGLPQLVSDSIVKSLKMVFGDDISDYRFAIRSSATGEDTEQMSAAGQMETFLGIEGIDEVLSSVKKCWASQFSFQAVEYKRNYGQLINAPMAVVIQEMIPCEVAGVMFTCDPVSGNPSFLSITANHGLGESVVSASVDPDTVTLQRSIGNRINIHSKQVGKKKIKTIMDGMSGIRNVEVDEDSAAAFCISETMALKLGQTGLAIEKYYGAPRDIEWGIIGENIFLFQSRPVTSLDRDNDFEIKHFFDSFQRTEKSFWSKANVGEGWPGATSPLSLDILHHIMDVVLRRRTPKLDEGMYPQKPYFQKGLTYAYSQVFRNVFAEYFFTREQDELQTKCLAATTFGRISENTELWDEIRKLETVSWTFLQKLTALIAFFNMAFFSGRMIRKDSKRLKSFRFDTEGLNSSQILQRISQNYDVDVEGLSLHLTATISSMLWNMSMLMLLSNTRGDCDNIVFSDFAYLLSTCKDVESADIPKSLQDVGVCISKEIDHERFEKMSVEDALNWLMNNSTSEAGMKFKEFLQRHGHRCLKELDILSVTWKSNPEPVIRMLHKISNACVEQSTPKEFHSFATILSNLQVKLSFFSKLYLRWLLPNCRRGVREREQAKSLHLLVKDKLRGSFQGLARAMVEEGRLPRKELLYFLCIDEIRQLIESRSPRLIVKALRRFKAHKELDELIFPEMCEGIPKPVNDDNNIPNIGGEGLKMTGVPVSQGVVTATARVVMNLEEASRIQRGDILVTHSTDIGWSPYFPLLSGVVTELGGIISHGAVVAREYGLPCVVNLFGATRLFHSGDLVILDGNNGTLQKVEEDELKKIRSEDIAL